MNKIWTPKENELVFKNLNKSIKEIQIILKKSGYGEISYVSIKQKRLVLRKKNGVQTVFYWTDDEINLMMLHIDKTASEIQNILEGAGYKRSKTSVETKMVKLRSKYNKGKNRKWNNKEIDLLINCLKNNMIMVDIVDEFRKNKYYRTMMSICHKKNKLTLENPILSTKQNIGKYHSSGCIGSGRIVKDSSHEKYQSDLKNMFSMIENCKEQDNVSNHSEYFTKTEKPKNSEKILIMGCTHIPFEHKDMIQKIVELESNDTDMLIVNGDFMDIFSVAYWIKDRYISLEEEYLKALNYLEIFDKAFKSVQLISGNHEDRITRSFNSIIDPSTKFLVNKRIMSRLAKGEVYDSYGNIKEHKNFKNVYYQNDDQDWFINLYGKMIIAHPKRFSKIDAKTVVDFYKWLMYRYNDLECVVMNHTHHFASVVHNNCLLFENGAMCYPLDYEKQGKFQFTPQQLSYTVLYVDKSTNSVIKNACRNVYCGQILPKKEVINLSKRLIKK